jgi:hypothetical protein
MAAVFFKRSAVAVAVAVAVALDYDSVFKAEEVLKSRDESM